MIDPTWLPPVRMDGINWHWPAGSHYPNQTDLSAYHLLVDVDGKWHRVESIGPVTPRIAAAAVPMTQVLADGEIWDLPRHGLNNGACIMLLSVGIDNSGSGVIGLGNGARSLGAGPSIVVGLNTEPASGSIRVWQPDGEGAKIRNMFGSTRTVSVLLFG